MDKELIKDIKFNEEGMVPCIVQDCRTGEVLMMAWMNKESLEISLDTGFCTYYSRSRKALWKKGETSGNVQKIVDMAYDCDGDTLLVLVEQTGSACHTGERSCFHNPSPVFVKHNILYEDYDVIADRKANPRDDSYTNYLFREGIDKICKKIGEESAEIIIASKNEIKNDTIGEIADFMYHLMVLMVECGITWDDVYDRLLERKGIKSEKLSKLMKKEVKE
jgi:phosphoribosyl-ATP pyrophosphohydrolase/phosphoribosyl-AMP cyclohydrolase